MRSLGCRGPGAEGSIGSRSRVARVVFKLGRVRYIGLSDVRTIRTAQDKLQRALLTEKVNGECEPLPVRMGCSQNYGLP